MLINLHSLFLFENAFAWGTEGHQIVGSIAHAFLTRQAANQVASILGGETLDTVSTWADSVKFKGRYAYTRPLHYVDVHDNSKCLYDDNVDCADVGCIVGAITRFSANASCTSIVSEQDRQDGLKFITHFIGDIAQPLHVCGRSKGGNGAAITYAGKETNLHSIWDNQMVVDRIKQVAANQPAYVAYLVKQITTGPYRASSGSWVSEQDIQRTNSNGNSYAAIDYASDSDSLNCRSVWASYDQDPSQDFADRYYTQLAPTVDLQLAKAGYRLASWLNALYSAC